MALKLETAQEILLNATGIMSVENIPLPECWRRVLAEPITADVDCPPFNHSLLDGYAVIADDVLSATPENPVVLRQIDNVPAGSIAREPVIPGTACRIMTGAAMPQGATGVVGLEDIVADGNTVKVLAGRNAGKKVGRRGEEFAAGEEVLTAGTVINTGAMAMLAVLGKTNIQVFKQPRVAIIATGSEIIPVEAPLAPGKIRNSNSYMLSAQVCNCGAQPVLLGCARDDVDEITGLLKRAPECDLVVTTGGASSGDYDLIGEVFKKLAVKILFEQVNIKPGKSVLAGVKDGKPYLGLSGNPSAAAVSAELLLRPLLRKMSGRRQWRHLSVEAVLEVPFGKSAGAKRFIWASSRRKGQGLLVQPLQAQGKGMFKSAVAANSLMIIPENSPPLPAGAVMEVLLLTDE